MKKLTICWKIRTTVESNRDWIQQTVEVSDATSYTGNNAASADNQQERPKEK